MRHIMLIIFASFLIHAAGCNHNKIPCPTYADSAPEKKKKSKPGSQQPEMPRATKAKSGVLPTDGGGKRTKVPR
ncbi:MAG: hypothetical protein JST83_11360 [Bacteroidetes bacterium]|nr:hypothetical protein [Bacteroidota bacterium]